MLGQTFKSYKNSFFDKTFVLCLTRLNSGKNFISEIKPHFELNVQFHCQHFAWFINPVHAEESWFQQKNNLHFTSFDAKILNLIVLFFYDTLKFGF